jgi:Flp pilus assembly secretin CpaC
VNNGAKLRLVCALQTIFWCGRATAQGPIEVQVEVTEVDQLKASRLGVEWLNQITLSEKSPPGVVAVGSIGRLTSLKADLHMLIQEGAAELLANPNLVTDSGSKAEFHAGGEIPYITTAALGTSNVEFKPYGVGLKIEPTLLPNGRIQMGIEASVSSPDQTNGVGLSGNTVPALLERSVVSRVTVDSESTMTLAGLVQTHRERTESGVPFLRRIPLLGRLFRWRSERYRKTTVIVFVTPRLMKT